MVERAEFRDASDEMLGSGHQLPGEDREQAPARRGSGLGRCTPPCEAGPVEAAGALEARDVRVHIRGVKAVDGVDLILRAGEILGLIGPNGAGKTTLVNVLAGFQRVTTGVVVLAGRDIATWAPSQIACAGVVRTFQDVRLFPGLTAVENVEVAALSATSSRRLARSIAVDLLSRVQLADRAGALAGGLPHHDARRLAIARALAVRPSFLLLDEPAAGLTEPEADDLAGALVGVRDELAIGLLVIEHDMRLIMRLSERIQVLDHGRTIAVGTPTEVRGDPAVRTAYLGTGARAHAHDS
jgi:ABC-type branched-subunit amino acid transport system ATPase component